MKAVVDQETCIGCTLCVQVCPEVYKMEEDKAIVTTDPVPAEFAERAKQGADECPVNAIKIE